MSKRARYWILGIAGFLLTVIGLPLVIGSVAAGATFRRHEEDLAQRIQELRERPSPSPVLFGTGVKGNGWELLVRGLDALKEAPSFEQGGQIKRRGDDEAHSPTPAELDAIFETYEPAVQKLRAAFSRSSFNPAYQYEAGWLLDLSCIPDTLPAVRFLAAKADRLHVRGQDAKALEEIALALGVADSIGHQGNLMAQIAMTWGEEVALESLRKLLEGHGLSAPELRAFGERLDRFVRARPDLGDAIAVDGLLTRRGFLDAGRSGAAAFPGATMQAEDVYYGSWKYLFSRRIMSASALELWQEYGRKFIEIQRLPSHQRVAAALALEGALLAERNLMFVRFRPAAPHHFERDVLGLTRLAFARATLAVAEQEVVTGRLPERLSDLVPALLAANPLCPHCGSKIPYQSGRIGPVGMERPEDDAVWIVRKR